jgi:TetR/AcrR family transcriptional repressor of nem operon
MAEGLSHKERTRARILDEAASAMRASGPEGISVAALMKRAGLTHGGFYAHFSSRDDLVAHAIDRMFEDSKAMLARHLTDSEPAAGLAMLIDYYLSERVQRFQAAIADSLKALGKDAPEALAASVLAEMVGAMSLARSVGDEAAAQAMLAASRERLKERLGLEG